MLGNKRYCFFSFLFLCGVSGVFSHIMLHIKAMKWHFDVILCNVKEEGMFKSGQHHSKFNMLTDFVLLCLFWFSMIYERKCELF